MFYSNSADEVGGILLEECTGLFIECTFKNNSAKSNQGMSLSIVGNLDWLCVERSYFFDHAAFPISVASSSATRFVDLFFKGSPDSCFYIVNDTGQVNYQIVNPEFRGRGMDPEPELPPEMMKEVMVYVEREPAFAWRSLYLLMGIFAVFLSSLIGVLPTVILPTRMNNGWTKQSIQTAIVKLS
jgi:hypothetical protein